MQSAVVLQQQFSRLCLTSLIPESGNALATLGSRLEQEEVCLTPAQVKAYKTGAKDAEGYPLASAFRLSNLPSGVYRVTVSLRPDVRGNKHLLHDRIAVSPWRAVDVAAALLTAAANAPAELGAEQALAREVEASAAVGGIKIEITA